MQSQLRSCKQAYHFSACTRQPCGPIFSVSCCSVGSLYVFSPRNFTGLSACCIWAMNSKSRKEVAARVWLHLAPSSSALWPVWHGGRTNLNAAPLSGCTERQQEDCRSFTDHLQCSTSSVMLYPNILGANMVVRNMLPSIPATCTCPKLVDREPCCWSLEAIEVKQA